MGHNLIKDQIASVRLFPRMVSEEEFQLLEKSFTSEEVLEVLKGFTKDKSPGPDEWTVEFFLHFYEMVVKDLLEAVEESRLSGEVIGSLNSTFKGRQILNTIGTTQECLHGIKAKKLQALILNIDLKKAYDCISWDFLRFTLLQ